MHEPKFEKQVRELLDDLSFAPSVPVWDKVQQQIGPQKRRRKWVYWLLPLLFAGGSLAFWLLQETVPADLVSSPSLQTSVSESTNGSKPNLSVPSPDKAAPSTGPVQPAAGPKAAEKTGNEESRLAQVRVTAASVAKPRNIQKGQADITLARVRKNAPNGSIAAHELKAGNEFTTPNEPGAREVEVPTRNAGIRPLESLPAEAAAESVRRIVQPVPTISSDIPSLLQNRLIPDTVYRNALPPEKGPVVQQKGLKGWQIGVQAQTGLSSLNGDFFHAFAPQAKAAPARFAADPIWSGNNMGNVNASALPPVPPQRSTYWTAGLSAKKGLHRHTSLLLGVQYSYYSTKLQVGQIVYRDPLMVQRDNSVVETGLYYRNSGQSSPYSNKYHFVEVPVGVEQQLIPRVPLYLQAGFSFGYLLSSNALHYDEAANIYYQNTSVLNRTQAQLFTGLQYRLLRQKQYDVTIGPSFRYGLTKLEQRSFFDRRHLYAVGLGAQIFFK